MVGLNGCVDYEAPHVDLYEVDVEQGFSISGTSNEEIGGRTEEDSWEN